jgi:hypothetical protein
MSSDLPPSLRQHLFDRVADRQDAGDPERRLWPDGAGESITCRTDDLLVGDTLSCGGFSTNSEF